jgi:Pyruvate/2-oxoacid:ferredoxin oxidoreductase delta subunit
MKMLKRIGILCFSPTNTTRKICNAVALGMGEKNPRFLDMTRPDFRDSLESSPDSVVTNIDHLIIGAPVYFGKLPIEVMNCLKFIKGNGKTATAVVVYGNRDYGFALYRMVELLLHNNFRIIAAGAFIGQHSYSDIIPVAMGRPDRDDLDKAYGFGKESIKISNCVSLDKIPIQKDIFSKSNTYLPLKPVFISKRCTQCGICANYCPTGILSPETGSFITQKSKKQCIGCMACVLNCTQKARIAKANLIMKLAMKFILRKAAIERLEPLIIFP